ncbi:MAG: PAC2 family protein [Planctomycetota bacterium]|nr:PAC2 family protein [Planctomycetota bacterium]
MGALVFNDPCLVAVWPGMGCVAEIAGAYLTQKLAARPFAEIGPAPYFDQRQAHVKDGLLLPVSLPRSVFYGWRSPTGGRDVVVLLGEAQPTTRAWAFCQEVVSFAQALGVRRVFTFSAVASPIDPRTDPRVFAFASEPKALAQVRRLGAEVFWDGEVSGLNAVLLSAAIDRGMAGACLLGEFPYFASSIPNPKAAAAVLRTFACLGEVELDLDEIDQEAQRLEPELCELHDRLKEAMGGSMPGEELLEPDVAPAQPVVDPPGVEAEVRIDIVVPDPDPLGVDADDEPAAADEVIAPEAIAEVEALFDEVQGDRDRASELKDLLDRHGLFDRYEDRFLDLFRPPGGRGGLT